MIYIVPAELTSPHLSLAALRCRARRCGYRIARDRTMDCWSLIDARLRLPLVGLDRVPLIDVARAVVGIHHS